MHLALTLTYNGHQVVGIDNLNSYYDVSLKYDRLLQLGVVRDRVLYNKEISGIDNFLFVELDVLDAGNLAALFIKHQFDVVIHLAAQAGVRYSITNPRDYVETNIVGFFNVIEACRAFPIKHFIYASSSSVYGNSTDVPFKITNNTDTPISLYAATKKSNELMAYTYANLFGIKSTGLRFFTVYGPWGRPDMAYYSFTKNIIEEKPIQLFNSGELFRDFTYIDDIITSIVRLLNLNDAGAPISFPPHSIYNIGNSKPENILRFVNCLEHHIGKNAIIENRPMQPGDVAITYSDTSALEKYINYKPIIDIDEGLFHFVDWYKRYYNNI